MNIKSDQELDALFKQLPQEIKPANDLWLNIESKLERRENREIKVSFVTRFAKYSQYMTPVAAVFICLIGFGLFMAYYTNQQKNTGSQYSTAVKELSDAAKVYNEAKKNLIKLSKSNQMLSDTTVAVVLKNIQIIDDAVNEIKMALETEPNNTILLAHLDTIYYEQTTLLLKTTNLLENTTQRGL